MTDLAIQIADAVAEVDAGAQVGWWAQEADAICDAIGECCGGDLPGSALPEPSDPAKLRSRLRAVAPMLSALTDRIQVAFDNQACAVVVPSVGVVDLDEEQRRTALYAFAAIQGDVMANHPLKTVVWDVRSEPDATEYATHSGSGGKARYHTDAGYLKMPPRFFLLYGMRAADCGGGESLIRDGRVLTQKLAETEKGRMASEVLSQKLPRHVLEIFHPVGYVEEDGLQYSPILSDRPLWRWARGNIRRGLESRPDLATPQVWEALDTVKELLNAEPGGFRLTIPTDGVLVIDNHVALHGRTAFTDSKRHMLRIRFHEPKPPLVT